MQNWREAEVSFFWRAFFSSNLTSFAAKKDPAVMERGRVRAICEEVEVVVAVAKLQLEAEAEQARAGHKHTPLVTVHLARKTPGGSSAQAKQSHAIV